MGFDKQKIYKRILKGGLAPFIMAYGLIVIIIGGAMGGSIKTYILFLIVIPLVFLIIMKRGGKYAFLAAIGIHIYTTWLYYIDYPTVNTTSMIFYAVILYSLIQTYSAKELFFRKADAVLFSNVDIKK